MSDTKSLYSKISKIFIENANAQNELMKFEYEKSKARENKHNKEWLKHPVNLNEVIHTFAPEYTTHQVNGKYIFSSNDGHYDIVTDMSAGYLRIYDKKLNKYVGLDGKPGKEKNTHYKIKKRGEM